MTRFRRAAAGALFILLSVAMDVRGQQSAPSTFDAGWWQHREKLGVVVAVGNVQLTWPGGSLRCDNAIIWLAENVGEELREGRLPVREVYAEGFVLLRHGENLFTLESSRGFVDPVRNRGIFFDAVVSTQISPDRGAFALTARAAEAAQVAADRFELDDVTLTTSRFAAPGYHIGARALRLQIDRPALNADGEMRRNVRYALDGSVLHLDGAPVLPLPDIAGNTEDDSFNWLKRLSVDDSPRFGPSVFLDVGTPIRIGDRRWGDWTLRSRYLGDRGPGVGLDVDYATDEYRGLFRGYYQRDTGRDRLFGIPPENDRGRVLLRHRHLLPHEIQLDVELSKITDRGFLPEYHEREFKEGKPQETLLFVKRAVENRAATLLASVRLNEFDDQVQHLPQVGYNLISEPIIELDAFSVYFDADYEVSRARRRFDDATEMPDLDSFRADFDNRFSVPFWAGPVKIEPFAGLRYTRYSNGRIDSRSEDRFGALFGARATTQLSRTFDVSGGLFGLDGLRHVILPEIEYLNVAYVSKGIGDFIPFDRIDRFQDFEVIRVALRNRLQTIWQVDEQERVVDFFDLELEWSYFPNEDRDNRGEPAGNLDWDLLFRPSLELTLLVDFEYSFRLDTMEIFNATLGWAPSPELQLGAGFRRYVDVNDVVLLQAQWRPIERLALRGTVGYDFEESRFQDAKLGVVRYGSDWVFEVELNWDNVDGFGFGVAFTPRALFDPRLRARSLRHEPRLYDFQRGLVR